MRNLKAPPQRVQRIVYLGTPEVAVPPLLALHEAGFDISLVVSAADKRRGRGSGLSPTPVKSAALELGLDATDDVGDVSEVAADLGVVVAFGQLISTSLLEQLAMVNLHFSLLPRWRGAAPVERAILAGDMVTGVGVMELVPKLDAGGIYSEIEIPIGSDQTAAELREVLVEQGSALLLKTLARGLGTPRPQIGDPVYAHKISSADLELDWTRPALELHAMVRVGNAWTTFRGKRLKVWESRLSDRSDLQRGAIDDAVVGAGDRALELVTVQPAGKARLEASAWLNGAQLSLHDRLGS
ncbi:MAG: methionyl-tRNA formyltransferase [Acidimicrobiales bacterium]